LIKLQFVLQHGCLSDVVFLTECTAYVQQQ